MVNGTSVSKLYLPFFFRSNIEETNFRIMFVRVTLITECNVHVLYCIQLVLDLTCVVDWATSKSELQLKLATLVSDIPFGDQQVRTVAKAGHACV